MCSLIEFANTTPISNLVNYIKQCNSDYYNGSPSITDSMYDSIKDILDERDPNNELVNEIGAPEKADRTKVKIPYYMGSMDKIKTTDSIIKFYKKHSGNYVLSDKEDGTSALLVKRDNTLTLYKRGDKVYGRDISHILNYINLPKITLDNIVIRGELIISKNNYNKYSHEFSNARNMVNGVVNSITINPEHLKIVDFICFEIIEPKMKPSEQFKLLQNYGFIIPAPIIVDANNIIKNIQNIPESYLYKYLQERRTKSPYEIDGIIITHDKEYTPVTEGNPKHSVGFKANSFGKITTIKNIEWNISKHGLMIPRIEFNMIELSGSKVRHCTGFNAKYIKDNNLGPGSIIRVVLSGEIIPYITEFIETTNAQLPNISIDTYTFDGMNFIITNNGDMLRIKQLTHFFKTLDIDNMGEGIIKKLITNGYNTISKILEMSVEDFNSLDGFKTTLSNKIYNNIHTIIDKSIKIEKLMAASLAFGFGFGIKRIKLVTSKYPKLLNMNITINDIISINGFEEKTANKFLIGLDKFKDFMIKHPTLKIKKKILIKKEAIGIFNNIKIVMSGFRDPVLTNKIEKMGGTIQSSINKETNILVVKDINKQTSKITKAKEIGTVEIISLDNFKIKYK